METTTLSERGGSRRGGFAAGRGILLVLVPRARCVEPRIPVEGGRVGRQLGGAPAVRGVLGGSTRLQTWLTG